MDLELQVDAGLDSVGEQLEEEQTEEPENFIQDDSSDLCEETESENQVQVAVALECHQNADQNPIANVPLENFPKDENLYQFVQKFQKVNHFIGACKKTDKDLTETDFSTSTSGLGIRFNIPEPIESSSFCGRENFLTQLHDNLKMQSGQGGQIGQQRQGPKFQSKLQSKEPTFPIILSQNENGLKIVSVGGPDGIGKTETAQKYIEKYGPFYSNIIWIEAESETCIRNSFINLANANAAELQIRVENAEGKPREIVEIVKEIYNKICEGGKTKPNLIVFDNAEDYQSCQNFFPIDLDPDLKKSIVILATSRNQEWISPTGKIQVLPLGVLTDDESLEFIRKQLELEIADSPKFQKESKEFIELVGGLPLSLQQAVAYIRQEKKLRKFLGKSYQISDYVLELKRSKNKFSSFLLVFGAGSDFSATVFLTWNVSMEKIQKLVNGKEAVEILEILSFLYADKIPSSFLHDLVPEIQDEKFGGALNLLEKYSLIKIKMNNNEKENDKDFDCSIKIHRQLQLVILQYLSKCEDAHRVKVLMNLADKCGGILENLENLETLENCKSSDIFLNIHQIVNNPFHNLPEELLDFLDEFGWVLWESNRYSESLEVWQKVCGKYSELLGQDHPKTLDSEHQIALNLEKLGRLDEAVGLLKKNLRKKDIHPDFGPDHFDTIEIKHQIASILRQQENNPAALFWFQQVLNHRNKNGEENQPQTLMVQDQMAQIHMQLGHFSKALALYTDVEKKQQQQQKQKETESETKLCPDPDPEPDHQQNSLITKQNKAAVLYKMEKFREAAKTFKEINAQQSEILGEKHGHTVNTLVWIAKSLEQIGAGNKLEEALQIYNKVYEIRKRNSGEDHPQTIHTKCQIARVLQKQEQYKESLQLFQQVLLQQNKIYGENHPETFKTQNSIAQLHSEQGDFKKALEMLEGFEKERTEILGGLDEHVLGTKEHKAQTLYEMDRFQEAAKIFQEVYDTRKETLGENHKETIKSLEWIKGTKEKQKTLTKAVGTWRKVREIR